MKRVVFGVLGGLAVVVVCLVIGRWGVERFCVYRLRTATDDVVREKCARVLGELQSELAVPLLVNILKTADLGAGSERHYAAEALVQVGPAAAGAVLVEYKRRVLAGNRDELYRDVQARTFSDILIQIGPSSASELIEFAKELTEAKREDFCPKIAHILGTLGRIGTMSEKVLPYVCETALKDSQPSVRASAVSVLRRFVGPTGRQQVTRTLSGALGDEVPVVRDKALEVVGELTPDEAVPAVIGLLSEQNGRGSERVVRCIGQFGRRAKKAVPMLRRLLASGRYSVRREASLALWRVAQIDEGASESIEYFMDMLNEEVSERAGVPVALALGTYGHRSWAAVPRLRELVRVGDRYTRVDAAIALWGITGEAENTARILRDEIEASCRAEEWYYPAVVFRKLGDAMQFQPCTEPILSLIGEYSASLLPLGRDATVYALSKVPKNDAVATDFLIRVGRRDSDWKTRCNAIYSLVSRKLSEAQIHDLRTIAGDESLPVRHAVKEVLRGRLSRHSGAPG